MKISTIFFNLLGIALFILGAYYALTASLVYMLLIGVLIMIIGGNYLGKTTLRNAFEITIMMLFMGIAYYVMFLMSKNFAPEFLEGKAEIFYMEIATIEDMISFPPNSLALGIVVLTVIFEIASNIIISRKR